MSSSSRSNTWSSDTQPPSESECRLNGGCAEGSIVVHTELEGKRGDGITIRLRGTFVAPDRVGSIQGLQQKEGISIDTARDKDLAHFRLVRLATRPTHGCHLWQRA
jgi:hypothetical protein